MTSQELNLSKHVDIEIKESGCVFGTGSGRGVLRAINDYSIVTNFTSIGYAQYPSGTGSNNSIINVNDSSVVSAGDIVFIKDSVDNAYTRTSSPLAEIATVVNSSSNILNLDCRLRRSAYTTGEIYKLEKHTCNISGLVYGDKTTVRASAVSVLGYIDPVIDLRCTGNSSAALLIHSCLQGDYKVYAKNLDNDAAASRLGYALIKMV